MFHCCSYIFPRDKLGDNIYIDGGLTGANSPDSVLVNILDNTDKMKMLSLGSGDSKWNINDTAMIFPSDLRAAIVILQTFLAAGVDTSNLSTSLKLKNNYFHLSPEYNPTFEMDDVTTGLVKIPLAVDTLLKNNSNILTQFLN